MRYALVLSGSIPPGTPPTIYRDIIRLAQEEFGVRTALDTSGEPLRLGATARPWLVKPNVHELRVLEIASDGWSEAAVALRAKFDLPLVIVTSGARGAILASEDGVWEAVPPPIQVRSAVGSGDSLSAGFLFALGRGDSLPNALKLGVAAGAANAMTYGAGFCTRDQVYETAAHTQVNKLG